MATQPLTADELNELVLGLKNLSRNLWWTWDQEAQEVFQELSPRGWQNLYHNAVAILAEVSEYGALIERENELVGTIFHFGLRQPVFRQYSRLSRVR